MKPFIFFFKIIAFKFIISQQCMKCRIMLDYTLTGGYLPLKMFKLFLKILVGFKWLSRESGHSMKLKGVRCVSVAKITKNSHFYYPCLKFQVLRGNICSWNALFKRNNAEIFGVKDI